MTAYECRFEQSPGVVFDALVQSIRELEKLAEADRTAMTISFATKVSGWSWGSQFVAQLTPDGDGTLAVASMESAGSLVAGMTERKKIERIWASAAAKMPKLEKHPASAANRRDAANAVDRVYGRVVADERFGGRRVRIFSNGYIQLSRLGPGPYQKLLRIEDDFSIQKKTGPGRAAAGVATLGMNFLATGNKRGDLYLTIVTDTGAVTLRESPPTNHGVKRASALSVAGRAVLSREHSQPTPASASVAPTTSIDVKSRLANAQALLDQGVISQEEYTATRANILKNL
jgi:hypothetical protein